MKSHPSERELIEYRFELLADAERARIAAHLAACGPCREQLERLDRRFSALELLREDVALSDALVSQVVEQSRPSKVVQAPARRRLLAWAGAAAAVLALGVLAFVAELGHDDARYKERGTTGVQISRTEPVEPGGSSPRVKAMAEAVESAKPGIPEEPPFAPASAIELVTLPRRDKVQLTIYNSADLTLVRERRNLTLKRGWNWLQFMWADTLIDPTSLDLEPQAHRDKIDVRQLVFPARLRELGRWLIRSEVNDQVPFEITYFTSGLSWRAFYTGTLAKDEKTMELKGYVRLANNSGEEYENARTRLLVGKVHLLDRIAELARRKYPYNRPGLLREQWGAFKAEEAPAAFGRAVDKGAVELLAELARKPKEIKKEGLSEYFLYTIEGTETIPDKWGKRLLSLEAEDIKVESLYKYDEDRWARQTVRFLSFANDRKHNLGQTPIPNGDVRIYRAADDSGHLCYIGGTSIKYVPVNEQVDLNLGPARLVEVKPILMDFRTDNYRFDAQGDIAGWDEIRKWKIEITNTRPLPIRVEITRGLGTAYWTLDVDTDNLDYRKHDATHARFELRLEPRSKRAFSYIVTTYHGARQDAAPK